ncbi:Uncharacterized protein, UPF0305 family [Methanobrevibacter gottschalkii]|uniref:UPF0305 protein SAMN05216439_0503 n=1 Tax=Methanobrevibacter gottschalkii TaxID=190974 RepID=A0A1H7Q1R2_9EURY|nr:DUF2115 family protein [Methanobrevibacter gottschalkii]SEL41749.1 Uncharacterized protein, UPF0305 family [Methanobrevibacter gottschalkii]
MKASELLETIKENIRDYPIEYLKNKVADDRYKDPLTKKLAEYNSNAYDDIYETVIIDDFDINDKVVKKIREDIAFYFDKYGGGEDEHKIFAENISLYLALIAKKPLHPYGENKKDEVYYSNGSYYCRGRIKYIHDEKSLCRYCVCKNVGFMDLF